MNESVWSGRQKVILALLSLAYLTDGIANQSLGLAIPALMQDWRLPREAFAPIAAFGLLGLTIGAVIGGMLGDRFGRRRMMILSTLFFGAMTMAQALAADPKQLLALRLLDGIGIGAMIPNGAALIAEFTPRRRRPVALAIGMTFIAVGAMLAGLIGSAAIVPLGWQGLLAILGGIGIAVGLLLLLLLPESPVWLAASGAPATESRAPLAELFAPGVAASTVFLWLAFFFCLLANYAMFSWVPAMLGGLGFPLQTTGLGMTALSLGGIVGGIGSGWLINRFGSRRVVLTLAAGGVLAALALGLAIRGGAQSLNAILGYLVVIGFFTAGLLNGLYTFSAFIYPDTARSTGVGAAAAAGRLGAIASSWAGVIALGIGGASSYFLLIAGSVAASLLAVTFIRHQVPAAD